jgi:phage shock protein C
MVEKKSDKEKKETSGAKEEKEAPKEVGEGSSEPYKRLYRSMTDRMVAGICGGLAEYFNIDPTIIRLIMVVSVLAGGVGIPAYIIGWIVIPEGTSDSNRASGSNSPLLGLIIGGLLLITGAGMIFRKMHYWFDMPYWFSSFFSFQSLFAVALIALGAFFILHVMQKDNNGKNKSAPLEHKYRGSLHRSLTDRKISGVCGGLGEYFNIDPTIIRIAWIVLIFPTGFFPMLIAYIVMALALPEKTVIHEDI